MIKNFSQYSEQDVINGLFSLSSATGAKGSLVTPVSAASLSGVAYGYGPSVANMDGVFSNRFEVKSKVSLAASGSVQDVIGMTLYDVKETDSNGYPLKFESKARRNELQRVVSGEAVPIVTRGIFEIQDFDGVPDAGSGVGVSDTGGGRMKVVAPNATRIGKFLTPSGVNGTALIYLDVKLNG